MTASTITQTETNLLQAFASETLASRRYHAFAVIAEQEDEHQVAVIFRYIARRRHSHAEAHLKALDALEDSRTCHSEVVTLANLRAAITRELHEHADLYPGMARTARNEGFDEIADWFEMLAKASRSHAARFQRALDGVTQSGTVGFGA